MKAATFFSALSAFALAAAQSSTPIINTPPSIIQCQPALLSFSGGTAPYFLTVLPAGQVSATPIEFLPEQTVAGSYTWNVNLPVGTNITISIRDSAGQLNYAAPLVVQQGTSSACVGQSLSSAAASASATGSTSAAAGGVSSIATTAAPSASSMLVSSGTAATVTAASGTPTSTINGTSATFNFTCIPQGLLTYGITIAELENVSLQQVVSYVRNWTAAAPGKLVNSSGTGVGAQRSYTIGTNVTLSETLLLNSTNSTGAIHQQWNFTRAEPVQLSSNLTIYNAFEDLTVYRNTTSNTTNIQFFILGCFNDQAAGLTALASFINEAVTYWTGQITGTGANGTSSASPSTSAAAKLRRFVQLA